MEKDEASTETEQLDPQTGLPLNFDHLGPEERDLYAMNQRRRAVRRTQRKLSADQIEALDDDESLDDRNLTN
eukprot:CAMPEP_0184500086 /NCGR_PEP_ID=MMETSP0113_2-20130426/43607_1 /TAXON_ID=91329 /ORGANISM="Norrisiella sphaerica, Strain BC52" /LENGTH=71 /DNA_ID=CAMNT_0026888301 /DNA_START=235 /DNA_END=450 /DNA_ORIENTATION=-